MRGVAGDPAVPLEDGRSRRRRRRASGGLVAASRYGAAAARGAFAILMRSSIEHLPAAVDRGDLVGELLQRRRVVRRDRQRQAVDEDVACRAGACAGPSSSWRSRSVGSRSTAISMVRWPSRRRVGRQTRARRPGRPRRSRRGRQAERGMAHDRESNVRLKPAPRSARRQGADADRLRWSRCSLPRPPSPEPGERRRLDHPPSDRYGSAAPGGDAADAARTVADESPLPDRERVLRGIAGRPRWCDRDDAARRAAPDRGRTRRRGRRDRLRRRGGDAAVARRVPCSWRSARGARARRDLAVAGIEGGVLGIVEYLAERQGLLVPAELIVAGVLAALADVAIALTEPRPIDYRRPTDADHDAIVRAGRSTGPAAGPRLTAPRRGRGSGTSRSRPDRGTGAAAGVIGIVDQAS